MAKDMFVAGLKLIGVFNIITGIVHLLMTFGSLEVLIYVVQMAVGYYLLIDGKHVVQLAFKQGKEHRTSDTNE